MPSFWQYAFELFKETCADIVEAAINGTLPRRIGITRLTDLPPSWRKQREILGLRQLN